MLFASCVSLRFLTFNASCFLEFLPPFRYDYMINCDFCISLPYSPPISWSYILFLQSWSLPHIQLLHLVPIPHSWILHLHSLLSFCSCILLLHPLPYPCWSSINASCSDVLLMYSILISNSCILLLYHAPLSHFSFLLLHLIPVSYIWILYQQ